MCFSARISIMRILSASLCGLALALVAAAGLAEPLPAPDGAFIKAEKTTNIGELHITWKDFDGEASYELIRHDGAADPTKAMIGGGDPPVLINGWVHRDYLGADTVEYFDTPHATMSYGICAFNAANEVSCLGPSAAATPKQEKAGVSHLEIFLQASDRLGLRWVQTFNTVFSRASVLQGGNEVHHEDNDSDESVIFTQLSPNTQFTLKVCVRNSDQTETDQTCGTTTGKTLPLIPLAVSSVSVDDDQCDPDPHARNISFTYDNEQAHDAIGLNVRLIKDNQVVQQYDEYLNHQFGVRTFHHRFTGLSPFTGYEAWVVPYNQTGVGTSAGVGFTTPTAISPQIIRLSGKSVMLRWLAPAFGTYEVQRRSGASTWNKLGDDIRTLNSTEQRIVIDNMAGPQALRVTWKLAYLCSQSDAVTATPLPAGTPEFVSVHGVSTFIPATPPRIGGGHNIPGISARMGTRQTVTFRTTVAGNAHYILQRKTATGWQTVDSTGSLLRSGPSFPTDSLQTLHDTESGAFTAYRVCRSSQLQLHHGALQLCSESSNWASEGLPRFH